MENFIDSETGEKFLFSNYSMVHRGGKWVHIDKKTKEELKNPKNGNILTPIVKEGIPKHLKSNDKTTRVEMLQKRSKDHFKKEISEQKYEMNKESIRKFESM